MRQIFRRRGLLGGASEVVDPYADCLTLEFTETSEGRSRPITADNANVTTYLDAIIIDGVEYEPTRNYSHSFSVGTHKVGWRFNTTIIYHNIMALTSGTGTYWLDNATITIPSQITEIKSYAMRNRPAYYPYGAITCRATTPPDCQSNLSIELWDRSASKPLYVPAESVDLYKAATGWSQYASYIRAIPE